MSLICLSNPDIVLPTIHEVRYSPNIISKVASEYQNSIVSDFFKSTQESLQNLTYKLGLIRENTDGRCIQYFKIRK